MAGGMTADPSLLNILASTLSGCERSVVSVVENTRPPTFSAMILAWPPSPSQPPPPPFMFGHNWRPIDVCCVDFPRPNAALKERKSNCCGLQLKPLSFVDSGAGPPCRLASILECLCTLTNTGFSCSSHFCLIPCRPSVYSPSLSCLRAFYSIYVQPHAHAQLSILSRSVYVHVSRTRARTHAHETEDRKILKPCNLSSAWRRVDNLLDLMLYRYS